MIKGRRVTPIVLIAILGAACGAGAGDGAGGTTPDAVANESVTPSPDESNVASTSLQPVEGTLAPATPVTTEPDPGAPRTALPAPKIERALQPWVDEAVADLAARLDVPAEDITVGAAETTVWPDGSLGCPQPGVAYTQVQVEGVRAVLLYGATTYFYHGGGNRPGPWLCENPGV